MIELKEKITTKEKIKLSEVVELPNIDIYKISLQKVIEERCDELDYIIEDMGYEIIYRELNRVATSIYNYSVYFHMSDV